MKTNQIYYNPNSNSFILVIAALSPIGYRQYLIDDCGNFLRYCHGDYFKDLILIGEL